MPSPDDIGAAARDAAQVYGAEQYAAGATSRQGEVDELKAQETADVVTIATLRATYTTLQAAFDAYKLTHPDTQEPPPPALPYVGAAHAGNGDVTPMEKVAGRPLGLHRTYWNFNPSGKTNVNLCIAQAKADFAAGRKPWVSLKLRDGMTWGQGASGAADADAKALNAALKGLDAWVAICHEPEGDGILSDWVKLQQRLLPLLTDCVPWIILTGWDTFYSKNPAYTLDALYPTGTKANIGIDIYNRYGDSTHPTSGWTDMKQHYDKVAPEAVKRGVDWAIAETGYTDAAAAKDPDWLTRAFDDMANHPVKPGLGLAYFDSSLNSNGTWPLTGVKVDRFNAVLKRSHA